MSIFKTEKSKPYFWYDFQVGGQRFHGSTRCTARKQAEKFEELEKEKAKAAVKAQARVKTSLAIDDVADRYWLNVGQHHAGSDTTSRDLARLVTYFGQTKLMTDISDVDVAALVAWRRGQKVKSSKKKRQVVQVSPKEKGDTYATDDATKKRQVVQVTRNKKGVTYATKDDPFVAPATVNRSTTEVLKKLFTFCKGEGVRFEQEPKWKQHFLPEPEERVRELHGHESQAIDDNMRDDYAPIFDFIAASGWRRGAAVTLQWSEVNFSTKTITKLGKGGRRITLKITPSIHAILWPLQGHHETAVFTYIAQKTTKDGDGNVLLLKGKRYPITAEGLKTRWRRTRDDAGLQDFRFHDFRHDFATKLLRQSGNLKLVQKALGHRRIETTMKYAHVLDDEVADAIEALNASRANSSLTTNFEEPAKAAG